MRYEWNSARARGLFIEREPDGIIETNAGPDDFDAHEEVLRLAERERRLREMLVRTTSRLATFEGLSGLDPVMWTDKDQAALDAARALLKEE